MPAPHVKDLYELYQKQGEDGGFDACINMIELLYASKDTIPVDKIFKPWDEVEDGVKDKIMPVLINKKWNEEILRDTVHKEFLDFAIILWAPMFETSDGNGTVRVNKKILDLWGVSENELWEVAFRNLKNEKFLIQDLVEAVSEVLRGSSVEGGDILSANHEPEKEKLAEGTGLEHKTAKPGLVWALTRTSSPPSASERSLQTARLWTVLSSRASRERSPLFWTETLQ